MQLVIFIGLQASGKSTFFRTYLAATHRENTGAGCCDLRDN